MLEKNTTLTDYISLRNITDTLKSVYPNEPLANLAKDLYKSDSIKSLVAGAFFGEDYSFFNLEKGLLDTLGDNRPIKEVIETYISDIKEFGLDN